MNGALPPSSIEQFKTLSAAFFNNILPIPVEPVKDNLPTLSSARAASVKGPG